MASGKTIRITANGRDMTAELGDNASAEALLDILSEGPLVLEMEDYAGMEKVADLKRGLPSDDRDIRTGPGDIILYLGRHLAIYYGENEWSLTRLGRIAGTDRRELVSVLGRGDVTVTLSLISP